MNDDACVRVPNPMLMKRMMMMVVGVEVVGLHGIMDLPTTKIISVDTTWTAEKGRLRPRPLGRRQRLTAPSHARTFIFQSKIVI